MAGYALVKVPTHVKSKLAYIISIEFDIKDLSSKDPVEYLFLKAGYTLVSKLLEHEGTVESYSFVEKPHLLGHDIKTIEKVSNLLKDSGILYKIQVSEPEEITFTN